ncbi:MAG TPA: hypothetical protein VGW34_16365 [Allosphingosinicella sp.]|nr:hypothetical protein [Allosphingosinicella sp.]
MPIHLLLKPDLAEFNFNPACPRGLTFQCGLNAPTITIKPAKPEHDPFGYRLGLQVRITHTIEATPAQVACIAGLIENRADPAADWPFQIPYFHKGELVVDERGSIQEGQSFWFEWLPLDLKDLVDDALEHMWKSFLRFIYLLRWQQDEPLPTPARPNLSAYWRVEESTLYFSLPQRSHSQSGRAGGGFAWQEPDQAIMRDLWSWSEQLPPLAQELRNEALLIRDASPRSSLLMAVSALEVGIKTHIARIAPDTEWLLLKMPSPPVEKLLRHYLPHLHAGNNRSVDWEKLRPLFGTCAKMVEDRNKLAHGGQSPSGADFDHYHDAVGDLLHVLDYLEGQDWPRSLVSPRLRKELGWPEPESRTWRHVTVTIKSGPDI